MWSACKCPVASSSPVSTLVLQSVPDNCNYTTSWPRCSALIGSLPSSSRHFLNHRFRPQMKRALIGSNLCQTFSSLFFSLTKTSVAPRIDKGQQNEHSLLILPSVPLAPRQDGRLDASIGKTKFPCEAGRFRSSGAAQKSLPFIHLPPGTVSERGAVRWESCVRWHKDVTGSASSMRPNIQ